MKKTLLCTKNPMVSFKKFLGILSLTFFLGFSGLQVAAQTTLYFKGTGALNNVNSWGTNTDGTGTAPTDFTTNDQTFIIVNTTAITHNSGLWAVTGTNSKIVMGNPTYATPATPSPAITITIAAGSQITSSGNNNFDVSVPSSGTHKIVYQNTSAISFQVLTNSNLELVFDGCTMATSTSRTFGNVSLINGANVDMGGASAVMSNLTVDAGCILSGPIGSSSQYIAIRAGGSVVINGTFRVGRQGSVTAPAVGGLYTTGVVIPVVTATSNGTLLFESATLPPALTLGPNSTIDYYRGTAGQTATQGITPWAYANLTLSNLSTTSNKSFAVAGNITVSGTLTINLASGATITQPSSTTNLTILPTGRLVINSATALATNGKLTLKSNATNTGSIGTLATGASITGNVTIEQYIPAGFRKYRFLSHPFNAAQPLSQLTTEIDITGNTAGTTGNTGQTVGAGFTSTATNNPSAYYFSTADANGDGTNDAGWKAFLDATTANWGVGQGVRVLTRGTKGQAGTLDGTEATPEAVTLEMTGVVNTGNISIPLVTGGGGSTAGYNLVGNPYPSPVDIGAVLTTAGGSVGNAFFLRNPQTGSYTTVSPIPSSYIIPAHTAFFVKANAASNLNFTEANKNNCTSCSGVFFSIGNSSTTLGLQVLSNGLEYDNLVVSMDKNFSNNLDEKDAEKILNDGLSLYALSADNHKLAATYVNSDVRDIPLGIVLPASYGKKTYTIKVSLHSLEKGMEILLHDKLNNTYTLLQNDVSFNLAIDAKDASQVGEKRLSIVMRKN